MAVGVVNLDHEAVRGVRLAATSCGIKTDGSLDLVLFEFAENSQTAGVFTQSLFAAAPVKVCQAHLAQPASRYLLINSGNANAGVGDVGYQAAIECCEALAALGGVEPELVLPFSTGVIGEPLQVSNIKQGLPALVSGLSADHWMLAAEGIMTTDTRPKIASRRIKIGSETITLTGIAKGAGMIQPNMATMLCYIVTDAVASQTYLQSALTDAIEQSFNRITVDSDTSTNDSCMLTATAQSALDLEQNPDAASAFIESLNSITQELAHGIVRDAEGATKFVQVKVTGGKSQAECLEVAYAIANSPLMKTALFASDANWGRIVMAIGKAKVDIDINLLDVFLGNVQLMQAGQKDKSYTEEAGAAVVAKDEILIHVDINQGEFEESVWTSDLSHEYVRINAEYRT